MSSDAKKYIEHKRKTKLGNLQCVFQSVDKVNDKVKQSGGCTSQSRRYSKMGWFHPKKMAALAVQSREIVLLIGFQ